MVDILDSMDEWDFQGEVATCSLTANVQEYVFPADILTIKRVEVDYDNKGVGTLANLIDSSNMEYSIGTSAEINKRFNGSSPKYDVFNGSLFLYPVPYSAVTEGMKIWYTKEVSEFTATVGGNTAEPVFPEPFHRILSLGASLDYARRFEITPLISFCERELYGVDRGDKQRKGLIEKMKRYYSSRTGDKILSFKSRYYKENYK